MFESLRHTLLEPKSIDEDARRREYILNIILVGSIVMLVVLDGVVWYDLMFSAMPSGTILSFSTFSLFPAFFLFLYALSRRGFFVVASYLLIIVYFIGNTYSSYRWGVDVPTSLVGFALLIIIASILISTRFAFFVAGAIALVVLPLWYVQLHGIMVTDAKHFTDGDGIALVVLYVLITTVAWLANREIERSLTRARKSELALKEERDLLEVKVEERTRELQAAQLEKIDHLYRFAEFGQLASGLFHDLTSILSGLSLRLEKEKDPEAMLSLESAFGVHDELGRFTDAVRKQLSREDIVERFSPLEGIERALQLLSHKAHAEHVRLAFDHDASHDEGPMPLLFGNPAKFHQIIMNLVLNAIEASATKVNVLLMYEDEVFIIRVSDDGHGISVAVKDKIFEPFFTTKHAGANGARKGIGIGLAITKHIIQKDFHGVIEVKSEVRHGTTFTVRLPLRYERSEQTKDIADYSTSDLDHSGVPTS